jgi:hypothetical protein
MPSAQTAAMTVLHVDLRILVQRRVTAIQRSTLSRLPKDQAAAICLNVVWGFGVKYRVAV